jgi:hypothetical protein
MFLKVKDQISQPFETTLVLNGVIYCLLQGETPLDCLLKWYQRTDMKFSPAEQSFFEEIQMRLRTALEKGLLSFCFQVVQFCYNIYEV